jgi:hypothetical protein
MGSPTVVIEGGMAYIGIIIGAGIGGGGDCDDIMGGGIYEKLSIGGGALYNGGALRMGESLMSVDSDMRLAELVLPMLDVDISSDGTSS